MDRHLLIAEIRKRPELWVFSTGKKQSRVCIPDMWKDVSQIVGVDVDQCKRKWKNLRDAYRAELKRIETRIENDILKGVYNTKNDYNSKWVFFEPMSFIQHSMKKPRPGLDYENSNSNDNNNYDYYANDDDDLMYETQFNNTCDIKLEPHQSMDEDDNSLENDDEADDTLFNESKYYNTPPALSRRPPNSSVKQIPEYNPELENTHYNESQYLPIPQYVIHRPGKISIKNFSSNQQQPSLAPNNQPSTSKFQNFGQRSQHCNDQMNFLENLEKEEQHLITSTRRDITHSNKIDHIGDSDYNFLVSFLPQMKKMSELQNLQFRAKMSEMVLKVLSPSISPT